MINPYRPTTVPLESLIELLQTLRPGSKVLTSGMFLTEPVEGSECCTVGVSIEVQNLTKQYTGLECGSWGYYGDSIGIQLDNGPITWLTISKKELKK